MPRSRTLLTCVSRSLTPSNSRPHTPTSSSKGNGHPAQSPPHRNAISSPPKRPTYSQPLSQRQSGWGAGNEDEDDGDDDDEQHYYNENVDEDEFGLPSITSLRSEAKNKTFPNKPNDPGGGLTKGGSGISATLPLEQSPGGGIADSSDIAEVRESLSYPSAKKSEGKILRPQYKDILRGLWRRILGHPYADTFSSRSCQLSTPHQPSTNTSERLCKRIRSPFITYIAY